MLPSDHCLYQWLPSNYNEEYLVDYQSIGTKAIYVMYIYVLDNIGMNFCAPGVSMTGVLWISV